MAKKTDNSGAAADQTDIQANGDEGAIESDTPGGESGATVDDAAVSVADSSASPATPSPLIRALILRDCGFGDVGTVVQLERQTAETGRDQGALDLTPAAVQAAGS